MGLENQRVILTGAAGGIGSHVAKRLHERGAQLALIDANEEALSALAGALDGAHAIAADLSTREGCQKAASSALEALGGVDLLINLAGIMSFRAFEDESDSNIEKVVYVNLIAPMILTRCVLPSMLAQDKGRIVNVGSIFGSIGFAYFSAYSTSKFGLRGFSEALRRELYDTNVKVIYVAPRAVKTALNTDAIMRMGRETKMHMDEPALVADKIIKAIDADRKEAYIGWPESFFVRINALFPGLVDRALAAQNRIAKRFAKEAKEKGASS